MLTIDIDPLSQATLQRIALPSVIAAVAGFFVFDDLSLFIRSFLSTQAVQILNEDAANQIEDFCKVTQILFAVLAGSVASSLYAQQVAIHLAFFKEVSVARSLLEQTSFLCWGRPWYQSAIACIRDYVETDLCCFSKPPAHMVALKPKVDPLECIMYMTSVGVPSVVCDSIKSLRSARGDRLGALQRKCPVITIVLLYVLAILDLEPFIMLGAGATDSPGVLNVESWMFGFLTGMHMLLLRTIDELWQNSGGLFNVDTALEQMIAGLREELEFRAKEAPELNPGHPSVAAARRADAFGDMVPDWDFSLLQNMSSEGYL